MGGACSEGTEESRRSISAEHAGGGGGGGGGSCTNGIGALISRGSLVA